MESESRWTRFLHRILPTRGWQVVAVILLGIGGGITAYLIYASRVWSYAGNDPATCVNCHVMEPYYATWSHSSHGIHTDCNDCHVPHDNVFRKYFFKASDGLRHSYVFTMRGEPQSMKAIPASQKVIYENCVRCHTQLNQEFVKTGMLRGDAIAGDSDMACWDCHRDVPHGGVNSLSSTPHSLTPFPESPVPEWISKAKRTSKI